MAFLYIDENSVPAQREATKYYVSYKEKLYPPKYVIGLANKFANGYELKPTEFSGGEETNNYLRKLGFAIAESENDIDSVHRIITNNNELSDSYRLFQDEFQRSNKKNPYEIWEFKVADSSYFLVIRDNDQEQYFPEPFKQMEGKNSTRAAAYEYFYQKYGELLFEYNNRITICSYNPFRNKPLTRRYYDEKDFLKFIPKELRDALETTSLHNIILDIEGELWEEESRVEGAITYHYGKKYERDAINRGRAIAIHGLSCKVCGFNFEKMYGERGKDFIEVHHINPLSHLKGKEVFINPETDLVPVCSNCHRMIHRRHDNVLTIDELKELVDLNINTN